MKGIVFHPIQNLNEVLEFVEIIQELLEYSNLASIINSYPILAKNQTRFLGVKINNLPSGFVQFQISTNLEYQKFLRIDELIVLKKYRRQGIGGEIINYLENIALKNECQVIFLATGIRNSLAQKFYFNNGFEIGSLYMYKNISKLNTIS